MHRVRIGSAHYIFDDEKTKIPTDEQEKFNNLPNSSSHIYLAIGGTLAAVICIKDPVREEAKQVIADLHTLGIKKVVMMTGDSKRNAQRVTHQSKLQWYRWFQWCSCRWWCTRYYAAKPNSMVA